MWHQVQNSHRPWMPLSSRWVPWRRRPVFTGQLGCSAECAQRALPGSRPRAVCVAESPCSVRQQGHDGRGACGTGRVTPLLCSQIGAPEAGCQDQSLSPFPAVYLRTPPGWTLALGRGCSLPPLLPSPQVWWALGRSSVLRCAPCASPSPRLPPPPSLGLCLSYPPSS